MSVERKMRGPSVGGGRTEGYECIRGDFQGEGLIRAGLQSKTRPVFGWCDRIQYFD
ncbi:unnamed protein product [Ectocarpus sp. 12 AP-2014]